MSQMAVLPGERYLIQRIGDRVILFERYTEREITSFPVGDPTEDRDEVARAQKLIHDSPDLSDEEKCFAHFWSGYFWAYAGIGFEQDQP